MEKVQIEEEYKKHVVPEDLVESIENPYILILNIEDNVKELEKTEKKIIKKKRRNRAAQTIFLSGREVLKEEELYYDQVLELINDNIILMYNVGSVVDPENLSDMIKLIDFMVTKYTDNMAYFASLIEGLDLSMQGISFVDNSKTYSHPAVKEFVENKINALKSAKMLEKTGKK